MRGKKDLLASLLFNSSVLKLLRLRTRNNCTVVSYHRIKIDETDKTIFDDALFGPTQAEFEKQVLWLKKNTDVVSEDELLSIVRGEYSPPQRTTVITFDDGYICNYTLAYPVLKSLNVPAIFFIPTQLIEERFLGWWDILSFLIKTSNKNEIIFLGRSFSQRRSLDELAHFVLSLFYQNKYCSKELLLRLANSCEVDLPDSDIQSAELVTWDQLREISQENISIGSHTHSHTILSGLDVTAQKRELDLSKKIIERQIGLKVRSFSYPVGNYNNFTSISKKLVAETGYDLAFSFLTGINSSGAIDPMDIKRIVASNYFPRFVSTFDCPELFCDSHDSIVSASGLYE